jgi:hypothetical protein
VQRVAIYRSNAAARGHRSTPQGVPMMGEIHRRSGVSTRRKPKACRANVQAMNIARLIDPDAINKACVRPLPVG